MVRLSLVYDSEFRYWTTGVQVLNLNYSILQRYRLITGNLLGPLDSGTGRTVTESATERRLFILSNHARNLNDRVQNRLHRSMRIFHSSFFSRAKFKYFFW